MSSISNNRCKLLILDLDNQKISLDNLRTYFTYYGPIEWIETFSQTNSAIIYFSNHLPVDHLIQFRTCFIGENRVRLRRFRLDENNWNIDSHTLHIKFSMPVYPNNLLTEEILRFCFRDFQSNIVKIDLIVDNQALITFSHYDYVDQILLLPTNNFIINGVSLVFERMIGKIMKKPSRWDQESTVLSNTPVSSDRDPVVYKLLNHIEYLTKQLRNKPNNIHDKIERLESEVFILKNENAKLKSQQKLSTNKNIEQRLTALEDVSNRFINKKSYNSNRRERSISNEKSTKRRRKYEAKEN